MGYFKNSGFGGTKASRDANYVTPGHYVVRLDSVRMKTNKDDDPIFVIEQTPLHIIAEDKLEEQGGCMNGKPVRSNKRGVQATHLIPLTGKGKAMAWPNIMAFGEAVIPGFAEASEADKEETMDLVVTDEQPLAGLMVEVVARSIKTRSESDFTKITYVGVVDNAWRLEHKLITQEEFDLLEAEEG
jgi:hypothetical protein